MKKHYLKSVLNENSIMELLSVLKKDSDLYKKSIEEKYGDTYQNVKKKYGIKFLEQNDVDQFVRVNINNITYKGGNGLLEASKLIWI